MEVQIKGVKRLSGMVCESEVVDLASTSETFQKHCVEEQESINTETITCSEMAGMFSMLNNQQSWKDKDKQEPSKLTRDNGTSQRKLTPTMSRRHRSIYMTKQAVKPEKTFNSLPKGFKSKRRFFLHPMLRKGICTAIIGGVSLVVGTSWVVVYRCLYGDVNFVFGWICIFLSVLLILIGLTWFSRSRKELRKKKRKRILKRQIQLEKQASLYNDESTLLMMLLTSKHAAKWPTNPTCLTGRHCKNAPTSLHTSGLCEEERLLPPESANRKNAPQQQIEIESCLVQEAPESYGELRESRLSDDWQTRTSTNEANTFLDSSRLQSISIRSSSHFDDADELEGPQEFTAAELTEEEV